MVLNQAMCGARIRWYGDSKVDSFGKRVYHEKDESLTPDENLALSVSGRHGPILIHWAVLSSKGADRMLNQTKRLRAAVIKLVQMDVRLHQFGIDLDSKPSSVAAAGVGAEPVGEGLPVPEVAAEEEGGLGSSSQREVGSSPVKKRARRTK